MAKKAPAETAQAAKERFQSLPKGTPESNKAFHEWRRLAATEETPAVKKTARKR